MGETARIPMGEYMPDVPPIANTGLVTAKNAVPIHGGYEGIGSLAQIAGFTALDARPRGAIATIDSSGNPFNFAGNKTKLYRLKDNATGTEDISIAGGYNCSGTCHWEFALFRDEVIACNPNVVTQQYNTKTSTLFKNLGNTTNGDAPRAAHIGVIGTFVILGNTFDTVNGGDPTAIHWSAVNDPFNWPTPDTEVAVTVQSGRQPLAGNGGSVQGIVSGAEVGAIFQERAIFRADYLGGDVVFDLSRLEPGRGLLVPKLAIPFGRNVLFLSEDGWYVLDNYSQSVGVGRERIDRTFLADLDTAYFDRVSAVPDPDNQRIWILYPGAGNIYGVPNKLLIYDWALNQWSHGELNAELLTVATAAGLNLDSPHTTADPDTDGVDGAGLVSFDERIAVPGAIKLGAYDTSFVLSDFSAAGPAGVFESGRRELSPGSRSMVTEIRALVDSVTPTIQVSGEARSNDTASFSLASRVDEDGKATQRVDGRYHRFRMNTPSGFTNAVGFDVGFQRSGTR